MASKDRPQDPPKEPKGASTDNPSTGRIENVLPAFQEASSRFLQANLAAQESAVRLRAQAWLDYQDEVRRVEQEAYRAVMEATRKHLDQLGQQATGSIEQVYSARTQSQFEYENEVRRVYADTQAKLAAVAQKAYDENESGSGDAVRQLNSQRQDAYKTYLSDLQQAWSGTRDLDPQTMNTIASHILFTMTAASQAG